jgi:cytochrome P450
VAIDYDPYAEEILRDPHPIYRALRDEAPAYYVRRWDAWAISRFQDIWDVSVDASRFSSARGTLPAQVLTRQQGPYPILNYVDPPEHRALRGIFLPLFLPRAVSRLEPRVRSVVVELLDSARARGELDAMNDFAVPFASRIAAHLIGVPVADVPRMVDWVRRFFQHDPDGGSMTLDGVRATEEVNAYCGELARSRRRRPANAQDAVSALLAFEAKTGRAFSDAETGMHLGMLVIGGSETIAKGIALLLALLARFPEQRECLLRDRSLLTDAFHETLRYDNPTQFLCRTLARDTQLHGQSLRKGQGVMLLYASGNRDEREFERPHVFDVRRRPERILSFSAGEHLCLGIHLARLEARVALEEILARHPHYEVDFERARPIRTEFIKGWASLPMRLSLGSREAS